MYIVCLYSHILLDTTGLRLVIGICSKRESREICRDPHKLATNFDIFMAHLLGFHI